jgi:hypothetical protein
MIQADMVLFMVVCFNPTVWRLVACIGESTYCWVRVAAVRALICLDHSRYDEYHVLYVYVSSIFQ